MTIAIPKTKAEQALIEQFEAVAGSLPGTAAITDARRAAIGRFAALGLPTRRNEAWKYTDLRALMKQASSPVRPKTAPLSQEEFLSALGPLAHIQSFLVVFEDGVFASSRFDAMRDTAYFFDPLSTGLAGPGFDWLADRVSDDIGPKASAVLALNTAFMTDGALLLIADGAKIREPIHLVFLSRDDAATSQTTRNMIKIGKGAEVTILESHIGFGAAARQTNTVTEIVVREGGRLDHIKLVIAGAAAQHLGATLTTLEANATYRAFQMTAGTGLARHDSHVAFAGEHATLDLSGVFLGQGTEHIDTTLVVDHAVPHGTSRELFKGVLDGRARGVFQGKIIVRPDAQKTDGKQTAQVLLLSPDAEFDAKPELEIYADDVVCGHGATSAQLDADLLFYCRARGIPLAAARALLTRSFIGEVFDKIAHETLRAALQETADAWLAARGDSEAT